MKKLFLILSALFVLGVFLVSAEPFTKIDTDNVITLSVENDFTLTEEALIVESNSYFIADHLKMLPLETTFQAIKEKGIINESHFKKLYGTEYSYYNVVIYTGINPTTWNPYINKFNSESKTNKYIKGRLFDKPGLKRFIS